MSRETWEFEGSFYSTGNSLNERVQENSVFPLVYFEGKIYKAIVKPETKGKLDRVGLWDIYYPNKKLYWVTANRVFQIIKQVDMIAIKVYNVNYKKRNNQNTTYTISDDEYKNMSNEEIEKKLKHHLPSHIKLQKDSYCKVLYRGI